LHWKKTVFLIIDREANSFFKHFDLKMSRPSRQAKLKALHALAEDDDDEELKCPPPLHERLMMGRGMLTSSIGRGILAMRSTSSNAPSTGRGILSANSTFLSVSSLGKPGEQNYSRCRNPSPVVNRVSSVGDTSACRGGIAGRLKVLQNLSAMDSGESGSEESGDDYEEMSSGDSSDEDSEEKSDDDDALVAKDGTRWRRQLSDAPSRRGPVRAENVFRQASGPSFKAKRDIQNDETAMSALSLIVNEQMLRKIQRYTIAEAEGRTGNGWIFTLEELECFIGLLYARGIMGAKNIPLHELWTEKWGNNIFRKTMPRDRFKEILRYIRFDEKTSRSARLENDKFALFSEIWNLFNENCQRHYTPTENLTVDEQLFPTKARCRFTQFMPNKPDKFGIKIWTLAEVQSKYFLHGIPYLGKDELRTGHTLAHHVVFQLVDVYLDNGYNITADNFFTQLPLAVSLKERKTTYVGTMRVNRREIPKEALVVSGKPLHFSEFFIEENGSLLTSYKGKKKKSSSSCLRAMKWGQCHNCRRIKSRTQWSSTTTRNMALTAWIKCVKLFQSKRKSEDGPLRSSSTCLI
jgi:hypothetical protein